MATSYVVKQYPLDLTASIVDNDITEEQKLDSNNFPVIIPKVGSFFGSQSLVKIKLDGTLLKHGSDYNIDCLNEDATTESARGVYDAIVFRRNLSGTLTINYHVIGGQYVNRVNQIATLYNQYLGLKRPVSWNDITNKPDGFPCIDHTHYGYEIKDWGALVLAVRDNTEALVNLFTATQTRYEKLYENVQVSVAEDITALQKRIAGFSSVVTLLSGRVTNLEYTVSDLLELHEIEYVPVTRKVNGKTLEADLVLTASDIGAISSKVKDTFKYGFNDELTNIGKTVLIASKGFNKMEDFLNLPIGYHGFVANTSSIPMPSDFGYIHKVSNGNTTNSGYYLFYTDSDKSQIYYYNGSANDVTPVWKKMSGGGSDLAGEIKIYSGSVAPDGFMLLSGGKFSKSDNPILASMFPSGTVPDGRGCTIRMLDDGRGYDSDITRTMGSYQQDQIQNITGTFNQCYHTDTATATGAFYVPNPNLQGRSRDSNKIHNAGLGFDASLVVRTGDETTMKNIAVNLIIKLG